LAESSANPLASPDRVTVAHVLKTRALDCEWGGWRAIIGAAAFLAVYHPTLSWAPVAVLGALRAMLDKRSGLLATAD
jgi:hypothetical protein